MRKHTNFQAVELCKKRWLEDSTIKRGHIDSEQVDFIQTTLELDKRDIFSLQDLRDFAVLFLTNRENSLTYNTAEDVKLWDCMSAITGVIDKHKIDLLF